MIDLILKILALAMLVFVWGFAWTWVLDKDEAVWNAAHGITAAPEKGGAA
jgi:hypothetical protein